MEDGLREPKHALQLLLEGVQGCDLLVMHLVEDQCVGRVRLERGSRRMVMYVVLSEWED
jgi:hypothetical protein